MLNKVKRKLKSSFGESIGEVLVALLISSLALVMLASMITTSTRIVTASRRTMKNYYMNNNNIITLSVTPESGIVEFEAELTPGGGTEINVNYYDNGLTGKSRIVLYK